MKIVLLRSINIAIFYEETLITWQTAVAVKFDLLFSKKLNDNIIVFIST